MVWQMRAFNASLSRFAQAATVSIQANPGGVEHASRNCITKDISAHVVQARHGSGTQKFCAYREPAGATSPQSWSDSEKAGLLYPMGIPSTRAKVDVA